MLVCPHFHLCAVDQPLQRSEERSCSKHNQNFIQTNHATYPISGITRQGRGSEVPRVTPFMGHRGDVTPD